MSHYLKYNATLISIESRDTTPVDEVPNPNINYGINLNESPDGNAQILEVGSDIYFDHGGQAYRITGSSNFSIPIEQPMEVIGEINLENFNSRILSELVYQHLSRQAARIAIVTDGIVLFNPPTIADIFSVVVQDQG